MRKMRENIVPSVLRFAKSVRLQRGGGWRAVRVGVAALVVVLWMWVYLASPPSYTPPPHARGDWSSGSPNLQVVAPIREGGGRRGGRVGIDKIEGMETLKINKIRRENKIQPIRVEDEEEEEKIIDRGEGEGGRGQILIEEEEGEGEVEEGMKKSNRQKDKEMNKAEEEEEQEQDTNPRYHNRIREGKLGLGKNIKDKDIFPNKFPKRRLILPGDTKLLEEEEEDEEEEAVVQEEEEGKWKGRNKEEIDNHAMEEEDDVVGIGDKNDKEEIDDKDFVEEDVGGETMNKKKKKKKRQKREKTNKENNDKNKNIIVHLENDPKNHLKENGHRDQQESLKKKDPAHDLRDIDLLAIEEEMRQRRSQVKQVCARYGLGPHAPPGAPRKVKYPPTPAFESFYIDRGDKLAWCPVYKAASTSWLYGFLSLAGISESYVQNTKEQVSTVARRVWPSLPYDEAMEAVSRCVKAMVVRHPFERLVSAFRDKLEKVAGGEKHGTEHFYRKFGKKIVEQYRGKDEEKENVDTRVRGRGNRSIDARRLRRGDLEVDIDVRGGMSYGRVLDKGVRDETQDEIGVKNGIAHVNKGNNGGNLAPPLRYTNAIDDGDPHHHQPPPPPPPPPPPRYKHILEDAPPPPPPPPRSPPLLFPDEIDDPKHPPDPPPQRYKHILVDDSPPQIVPENPQKQGKEPTFREFVRYLIDLDLTQYADDHWMPYHLSCTPCLLDFEVIAKFETLNRDQEFLLRKTNLAGKLNFAWRHLTKGSRTEEVVKRYFGEVSKKELLALYKKYKLDFEMFGYSVDDYLGYVKPE